ncbi:hypothetical protein C5612_17865 [Pseudomonas frederiksbergensis]|uniref:Uncharacterized protein n=1 Tax=Pseudomonas frederiksbergensis TaxID=104087 RepID=A0A2S8HKF6_9PSED|nr:hypothetical protein C5612_17865 [Pseudomonas frederiksbergensis]
MVHQRFWGCFAAQRGQAPSPQARSHIRSASFPDCIAAHKAFGQTAPRSIPTRGNTHARHHAQGQAASRRSHPRCTRLRRLLRHRR